MSKKNSTRVQTHSSTKLDPLAKYKAQAAPLIRIMFDDDDDTPDFMRDELYEILSDVENQTQVFWNVREIAEVAIPLMLQAADEMGVDWQDHNSPFIVESLGSAYLLKREELWEERHKRHDTEAESESRKLQAELEKDAEALSRIIDSKYTDKQLRSAILNELDEILTGTNDDAPVLIAFSSCVFRINDVQSQA